MVQNPFNGIERTTARARGGAQLCGIHSMELKVPGHASIPVSSNTANPFNGIERTAPHRDGRLIDALANPFNGIERKQSEISVPPLATLESIQWN